MPKESKVSEAAWRDAQEKWESGSQGFDSIQKVADFLGVSKALVMRKKTADGWVLGGGVSDVTQSVTKRSIDHNLQGNPPAIEPSATPENKSVPDDDRPRAEVVFPPGFDDMARRVAAEVVTAMPVRQKPVSGLVEPLPDLDRVPSSRSGEALIRAAYRERMLVQLERRRQRLLVVDQAFVKAAKSGEPKAAQGALNLAKAQEVMARLESELLLEAMEFSVNLLAVGRDVAAQAEPKTVGVVVSEEDRAEVAARVRAEEAGVQYGQQTPPGWK